MWPSFGPSLPPPPPFICRNGFDCYPLYFESTPTSFSHNVFQRFPKYKCFFFFCLCLFFVSSGKCSTYCSVGEFSLPPDDAPSSLPRGSHDIAKLFARCSMHEEACWRPLCVCCCPPPPLPPTGVGCPSAEQLYVAVRGAALRSNDGRSGAILYDTSTEKPDVSLLKSK